MAHFEWGFLDTRPSEPEDAWQILPREQWESAPQLAVQIATKHEDQDSVIVKLEREGWCVIVRGLIEIPLEWQTDRKPVVIWSETEEGDRFSPRS